MQRKAENLDRLKWSWISYSTISRFYGYELKYASSGVPSMKWNSKVRTWYFMSSSEPSRNWPGYFNCAYAIESGAWYGEFYSNSSISSDDAGIAFILQRPALFTFRYHNIYYDTKMKYRGIIQNLQQYICIFLLWYI